MYKAIVILLILGVHQATSLLCYECKHDEKNENQDCLDPLKEDKVDQVECKKCLVIKIERKSDQKTVLFERRCVFIEYTCENDPIINPPENNIFEIKCRTCSTDLCNSNLDEPEPTTTTQSTTTSTTTSSSTSSPNSQATTTPSSGAVRITEGFLMFIPIITISRLLSLA